MIRQVELRNFRCFENASLPACRRVNVVVGGNGAGKTALLEALFLTVGNPESALRLRHWRGYPNSFSGTTHTIQEALWGDLFFDFDRTRVATISCEGDEGDSRSLTMQTQKPQLLFDVDSIDQAPTLRGSVNFNWQGPYGRNYNATPDIVQGQLRIDQIPDAGAEAVMINSLVNNSVEMINRFSMLDKRGDAYDLILPFSEQFEEHVGLSIQMIAGEPMLYATVAATGRKVPVGSLSSGMNKYLNILSCIATFNRGCVLIDEIENGFHYSKMTAIWRSVIGLAKKHDCQIFASTHSAECLQSLVEAMSNDESDVSLIRAYRKDGASHLKQYVGSTLAAGIAHDEELR
ncbi:MAG: AAA family ATPase [Caulobacter sp.]|nr:AAA family ATPase [Caulobacter sp.]